MITGAPFTLGAALAGTLNSTPIALLAVGAAAFAVGWLPSGVVAIGALPVAGGFLLNVVTQSIRAPHWAVNLSPFAHLAPVPNTSPEWLATGAFIATFGGLIALGVVGYHRRDLVT